MKEAKIKERTLRILSVLFFIFIFLNDTTVYNVYFEEFSDIFIIFSCIVLFIFIIITGKIFVNLKYWAFIIFWLFTVTLSCSLAGISRMFYIRICYWTVTVLMITHMYIAKINFKSILYSVCKIFCIWCLICYFYTSLELSFLPITHTSDKLAYNFYQINLHGFFISNPISHMTIPGIFSLYRLDRPFGEPGIAQIFMNYGIIYYFFFSSQNKKEKIWFCLFTIGSILTFSLTGYIILLSIFMLKIYKEKKYMLFFFFAIIAGFIAAVMIAQKITTFSYSDRTNDYSVMMKTIVDNLPFGIGIGNVSKFSNLEVQDKSELSIGFYCGLLYPLMQYGILGIVYYYALYKSIKYISYTDSKEKKISNIAFLVFVMITLLTEPQADEPIIVSFIFDGLIRCFNKSNDTRYLKNYIKIGEKSATDSKFYFKI